MPVIGARFDDGSLLETNEILSLAYTEGSVGGYPLGILRLALDDRKVTSPSASQLAGGAYRQAVLKQYVDYYVNLKSIFPAVRGTLIHGALDVLMPLNREDVMTEFQMAANLPKPNEDIYITGRADVYYPRWKRLEDYKSCQKVPEFMPDHHLHQLAIYKWLLEWNGYPVEDVAINYISWWGSTQVREYEPGKTAMGNPLLYDEDAFVEWVKPIWWLLYDGYHSGIVPAESDCNTKLCSYCDVRTYCKNHPPESFRY